MIKNAKHFVAAVAMGSCLAACTPVLAQQTPPAIAAPALDYADHAAMVIEAPLIIDATILKTARITGAEAVGVPPGHARFFVTAEVLALIRGADAVPAEIGYLVDVPFDQDGDLPRLKRLRVLLFARPVPNRPGMVQLINNNGQQAWSPAADSLTRRIAREVVSPDAPPVITGVGNAFHTPGVLPGEGETQIFLLTEEQDPISISIRRRAAGSRNWAVSLGEIVDDSARPPARDTLLWYRLACGLPAELPADSVAADQPEHARIVREDYQLVLETLGPCRGSGVPAAGAGAGPGAVY